MIEKECFNVDIQSHSLQLNITRYGEDSIEIVLTNKNYDYEKHQKLKHFFVLLMLLGLNHGLAKFAAVNGIKLFRSSLVADVGFIAYLFYLAISSLTIVKKEKLLFCHNFAMQLETERLFSRKSDSFISASNIYDIRINEVIENIEIHYMLIVRTKGELFKEKPIIALFNAQKPPIHCLELIYKNLNLIHCKRKKIERP